MNQQNAAIPSRVAGKSLGQALREQRLKLGLSQEALAEAIGASTRSIRRWELDQAIPHEIARAHLCTVFGVEKGNLFGAWSVEQAASTPPALWHVPLPRNPFFTGREELLQALHERLKSEQTMTLTQSWAISGLGGIGKTQIALEYAYRHAQNYSTILWVSAATQENLQADLAAVAELLNLPEKGEHDHARIIRAVKQWLASHQDWLLILDNADDVAIVRDVLPAQQSGHLLLTTRAQALGPIAQRMEVETMGMAEGTLFLLRRARMLFPDASLDQVSSQHLSSAEAIAIEMDFLPLALDQAGAYIEEVGCDLATYLDLYRTHRADLLRRRGHMPENYPASVATTWSLNFQQVEQANPAAAELLRLCAFLEPDNIPEELLTEGGSALGPVLQPVTTDAFALNEAIEELRRFSLIQRDPQTRTLRLHRLVQAVLQDTIQRESQRLWAERVIRATSAAFPTIVEAATWPHCRRFLPQAQACSILIQSYTFVFTEAASLLSRTASYLQEYALYAQAESLYQQAVAIWEQALGPEHREVAHVLNRWAKLSREQGKYAEAESLYQRVLSIWEQQSDPETLEMARALNGLAYLQGAQGKYTEAEPLHQRALALAQHTPEQDQLLIAEIYYWLAILYTVQGKYTEAEPCFFQSLHIREQALPPHHPLLAETLGGMARFFFLQEKYAKAESLYQQALRICEQALDTQHTKWAVLLNNLAELYVSQGQDELAQPLFQQSLGIWEQAFGPNHTYLIYPLHGLADISHKQGQDEQAELLYQRALHIGEQALGTEHPNIVALLHGLANLSHKQGKDQQARSLYQRALSIQEQTQGPHDLQTAEILHDFALFQEAQNDFQEATALYQRALAIREQALGNAHLKTTETAWRLQNLALRGADK